MPKLENFLNYKAKNYNWSRLTFLNKDLQKDRVSFSVEILA